MLWAEEELGIGNGPEKWKIAWVKLIEILRQQKIRIKEGEISYVKNLMKATVPEVNEIIYNAMPDVVRNGRKIKVKNAKN